MGKRKNDPGLEYMISLGLSPAKSSSAMETQLLKVADKNTVWEVLNCIADRGDGDEKKDFYALKNRDLKLSLGISGAFDSDVLRKACNWIASHADLFVGDILEVGCDCGIMSCFLAKLIPSSRIVSIDRCADAIKIAKELADMQGIKNIEFRSCALSDITEKFDTVFSMRTMHENTSADFKEDIMYGFYEQAELCEKSLLPYASTIRSCLADHGRLVSFERCERTSLLLGWISALLEMGIVIDTNNYEEVHCFELSHNSTFQAFSANVQQTDGIFLINLFVDAIGKYVDFSQPQYWAWDAKILYDLKSADLIEGYIIEDKKTKLRNIVKISNNRFDETCIILHQNNAGQVQTSFHDISAKEELLQLLRSDLEKSKKNPNYVITKLEE